MNFSPAPVSSRVVVSTFLFCPRLLPKIKISMLIVFFSIWATCTCLIDKLGDTDVNPVLDFKNPPHPCPPDHLCKALPLLLGECFDCGVGKSTFFCFKDSPCSGGQSFAMCPVFLQWKHFPCLSSIALSSMVNASTSIALGSFLSVALHQHAFSLLLLVSAFFNELAFMSWLKKRLFIL
jgi:hypothetical protein